MESIKTIALARIYEIQGLKEDALKIYREILLTDPESKEAQASIKRLMLVQKTFPPTNQEQLKLFITPSSSEDTLQFQRWLLLWNSKI